MRTTRFSESGEAISLQTPLDKDPSLGRDPLPPLDRDQGQRPPEGTWDQAARQEVTAFRNLLAPPPPLPKGRMKYMCKNITLPKLRLQAVKITVRSVEVPVISHMLKCQNVT